MSNANDGDAPIAAALKASRAGALPEWALMRAIVTHDPWWVAAAAEADGPAPRLVMEDDGPWLHAWPTAARGGGPRISMRAETLLSAVHDGLAGLAIDPGGPLEVRFDRARFPLLRRWARADRVARIVRGLDPRPDGMAVLRAYGGWHVMVRGGDGGRQIMLAPDDRGRRLAAVFTAEDTARAFAARFAEALKGRAVDLEVLDGAALFGELAAVSGLDGIVFDCAGPLPPKAVQARFAAEVLRTDGDAVATALHHARRIAGELAPLLTGFLDPGADHRAAVAALAPRPGDAARVFVPAVAAAVEARYAELWAGKPPRIDPRPEQTALTVHACPAGMLAGENLLSRPFPGGYRALAPYLVPEQVWVCWRYTAPEASDGLSFNGLVLIDGRPVWFPKPYRVVGALIQ